ncbi:MAG: MBL fold metallo-hydrolase, partial [Clostridia bacterium]|nr:MBL fold metallo-hydrolase [Clostridia bacterium]
MRVRFLGTGTSQGIPVIACPCRVCSSADARDKR